MLRGYPAMPRSGVRGFTRGVWVDCHRGGSSGDVHRRLSERRLAYLRMVHVCRVCSCRRGVAWWSVGRNHGSGERDGPPLARRCVRYGRGDRNAVGPCALDQNCAVHPKLDGAAGVEQRGHHRCGFGLDEIRRGPGMELEQDDCAARGDSRGRARRRWDGFQVSFQDQTCLDDHRRVRH